MPPDYAELGLRSAFSFLEGSSVPEDLAARAAELELDTVALTDRGGVYGSPRLHAAAGLRGVRAIVGARLDVTGIGWVRLLCETQAGYRNLSVLLSEGHAGREKGECEVTVPQLERYAADLTCLAGPGLSNPNPRDSALLKRLFSNILIEVNRHQDRAEAERTAQLFDLAAAARLPAVATNDVYHARPEGKPLCDVLACIREHTTLDAAGRLLLPNAQWHLKSAAQMKALFSDRPDAIRNTLVVAERCEFGLENLGYEFPDYPLPPGETLDSVLRQLTYSGALERYRKVDQKTRRQIDKELAMITKLELAGYFLIVWDIVRFCRERDIMVQGRGSAANSAVCYALGITAVDAVGMEMLFERFLSEERGEWPDIDLDLPSGDEREAAIQYVYQKYGPHGAAMTANVITYRDRSALRETGKALGFSMEQVDKVAKIGGRWSSIKDPEQTTERLKSCGLDPEAARSKLWMHLADQILHLPRHLGQHSGGMVIARGRLDTVTPIEPASMEDRSVIQWDKDDCARLGIIKVDLLGLGMLSALEQAIPMIRDVEGVEIDLARLPKDDPEVYDMLCAADTVGLFQVESRAQMATLPRLKPRTFYDLVIEIALIRPGPITGQMVHPYLRRRAGLEEVKYAHPTLEPILRRTLGVPIFQEQLMRMAMDVAGFTGGEAEELRRAMGFKRSTERMFDIETRLREGMRAHGVKPESQEEIIRQITAFASYGFPESHSASFALIAYASAYLKHYHGAAFLAALLNAYPMGFYHPATLVKDAQRHDVRVLPIDVLHSQWKCTLIDPDTMRLGMRYVQGLKEHNGERIVIERERKPFVSLADLERRCRLSDAELSTLAELGAFASLGKTRRESLWQVARLREKTEGLLGRADPNDDHSPLPEMSYPDRVIADYKNSDMTVGSHPMQFWRRQLDDSRILSAAAVNASHHGQRARTAGFVITRQRPGSAKGFFFITLEDETGFSNIIVTPPMFEAHRQLVVAGTSLWVEGIVQNQEGVVHLKGDRFGRLETLLESGPSPGPMAGRIRHGWPPSSPDRR